MSDLIRAVGLVVGVGGDDSDVLSLSIPGEPWSKARPRHTRSGRTYQKADDRDAELRTRAALAGHFLQPMTGNVAMSAVFFRSSLHRIDADNMLKHVCDSANGVAWIDDAQVTAIVGIVEMDRDNPRTVLAFAPHASTMTRGTDWTKVCNRCDQTFVVDPKYTARKYCGKACSGRTDGLAVPVPCDYCQAPFRRSTTAQRLCSQQCRIDSLRDTKKAVAADRPMSRCATCDTQLNHRRGGQCRSCWLIAPIRPEEAA